MYSRIWLAAALALAAVPAGAQVMGTPGMGTTVPRAGLPGSPGSPGNVLTTGFPLNVGPLQFQAGRGFVPTGQPSFQPFGTAPFGTVFPTATGAAVSPFGSINGVGVPAGGGVGGAFLGGSFGSGVPFFPALPIGIPTFGGGYGTLPVQTLPVQTAPVQTVYVPVPVPVPVDESGNPVQITQPRRRLTVSADLVPTATGNATLTGYMGSADVVAPQYEGTATAANTGRGMDVVYRADPGIAEQLVAEALEAERVARARVEQRLAMARQAQRVAMARQTERMARQEQRLAGFRPEPRVAGFRQEQRVAGARQEQFQEQPVSAAEQQNIQRMQNMMLDDRPLREGVVISVGATGVTVQFTDGTETRTQRFPIEEVFFFQDNGQVTSALSEPELIQPGVEVLVPVSVNGRTTQPAPPMENGTMMPGMAPGVAPGTSRAQRVPSERVAGTRQTMPQAARPMPAPSQRVAGSRQTTPTRRPAR